MLAPFPMVTWFPETPFAIAMVLTPAPVPPRLMAIGWDPVPTLTTEVPVATLPVIRLRVWATAAFVTPVMILRVWAAPGVAPDKIFTTLVLLFEAAFAIATVFVPLPAAIATVEVAEDEPRVMTPVL